MIFMLIEELQLYLYFFLANIIVYLEFVLPLHIYFIQVLIIISPGDLLYTLLVITRYYLNVSTNILESIYFILFTTTMSP